MDLRPPPPTPEALESVVTLFEDAHQLWHDAAAAYHDPDEFRRRVEALIQAIRNVTFRLQAVKGDLPGNFAEWYPPWQEFMRGDETLSWLNDARIEVVKRKGLETASKCIVRIINSYLPPDEVLLSLPSGTATLEVVQHASQQVPDEWKPHVAIEVSRRWEVPNLQRELLSMFAYCLHILDALLLYVRELAVGSVREDPATFVAQVIPPRCLQVDVSGLPLTFEADTGRQMQLSAESQQPVDDPAKTAKRYKLDKALTVSSNGDLKGLGEQYHDMARRMFKKDGAHISMALLMGPDQAAEAHVLMPENRRDKFMMWHQLAYRVASRGFESLIATSEVWIAPQENIPFPIPTDFEGVASRGEGLQTVYAAQDGTKGSFFSEIFRLLEGATSKARCMNPCFQQRRGLYCRSAPFGIASRRTRLTASALHQSWFMNPLKRRTKLV